MQYSLVTCQTMLFVFVFSGVFPMHADDKPNPIEDKKPKLVKRGGRPCELRWNEGDVKEYLALPYLVSIDDITNKLEAVQSVGKYQIVKDKKRQRLNNEESDTISFELHGEDLPVLCVTVHDYQSWNSECDKLFRFLTSTVAMWSEIPDYYAMKKTDDTYTITRSTGMIPQKWHFELKKRFVIYVYLKPGQGDIKSAEKAIVQIDQVIRRLVAIIEAKDADVAEEEDSD